ncbi:MAG TPA: hypothetical protein VGI10_29190, partial [Polyangiaceae bacterium]
VLRATGRVPGFAQRSGNFLSIAPPFGPRVSQLAALPQRQTPLLMAEATHREVELKLVLPKNAQLVSDLPQVIVRDAERTVQVHDSSRHGELTLSRIVDLPAGRVKPKDYPQFLDFARHADEALSQSLRVQLR